MFRKMLREKQQLLPEECEKLLEERKRGVLSVLGDDDYPYGLPMDYLYCRESKKIYFHCGKHGHKLDALKKHEKASFCVYDDGVRREGDWALTFRSVIVFGKVSVIEERERIVDITRKLSLKYTPDTEYIENEITQYAAGTLCLEFDCEHISGKTVREA